MKISKITTSLFWVVLFLFAVQNIKAQTLYVSANSATPTEPYSSWETAAVTIQAAVDYASDDDTIFVTNGVYQTGASATPGYSLSNRVTITKKIFVHSVNGPKETIIVGKKPAGENAIRCIYLTNGAEIAGFTLSNGNTRVGSAGNTNAFLYGGGGVLSYVAVVSNCIIRKCSAVYGGGIYSVGSAIYESEILDNWTVAGTAGGILMKENSIAWNCKISGNQAVSDGGGVWNIGGSIIRNCLVAENTSMGGNGGGIFSDGVGVIESCTIVENQASMGTGKGIWAGTNDSVINSIIYFNNGDNWHLVQPSSSCSFSCTTPSPGGNGIVTADPLFFDKASGNFRLKLESECINSGTNYASWMDSAVDLEGNARVYNGTTDIGTYEITNSPPLQPENISPSNGEENVSQQPELVSSNFSDPNTEDIQSASQWQISLSNDFSTIKWDSGRDTVNLTSVLTPFEAFTNLTKYYWRVRYQDDKNLWSEWSVPTWFEIGSNGVPIITPNFLDFSTNETTKIIYAKNDGSWEYSFSATAVSSPSWLNVTPASATVSNETVVLIATAERSGLTSQVYEGQIIITPSVGDAVVITCSMVVAGNGIVADANGPYLANQGERIYFNGAGSLGQNLSYKWVVDGEIITNFCQDNITYAYTDFIPGTNEVILEIHDGNSPSLTDSDTSELIVLNVAPSIDLDGTYTGLTGMPVTLIAQISDPGISDTHHVKFDYGDGSTSGWFFVSTSNNLSLIHTYYNAGDYSVKCEVKDCYGAKGSDSASVIIGSSNKPPVAVASFGIDGITETNMEGFISNITLDGSASSDDWTSVDALIFDWREDVRNPDKPLLNSAEKQQKIVTIPNFNMPGKYRFHLVVNDGEFNSPAATLTINVPGVSGLVKSELQNILPLYGINLTVTNKTGNVATDMEGKFVLDTGAGNNIIVKLERNGQTKFASVNVPKDGFSGYMFTFPAPLCSFSALINSITNGGSYLPIPYAQAEIVVGNEIAFSGSAGANGEIAISDIPELWPRHSTVNYQVLYQKEGYESEILPLQVEPQFPERQYPVLHESTACAITGKVVGINNMPASQVKVDFGPAYSEVTTDEDGSFVINPIMSGKYFVKLSAPGFETTYETTSVLCGYPLGNSLKIRGGTFSVYGEIFDEDFPSHPISDVTVSALKIIGGNSSTNIVGTPTGYYDINVIKGQQRIKYEALGYATKIIEVDVQGNIRKDVFLSLPEPTLFWISNFGFWILFFIKRSNGF